MNKLFRVLLALYLVTSPILIVFLIYKTVFLTTKVFELQSTLVSKDAIGTYPIEAIQTAFVPHIGPSEAPVKIFWYADVDCSACRQSFQDILEICQTYPREVVVFAKLLPSENEFSMRTHRLLIHAWLEDRFVEVSALFFSDEIRDQPSTLSQWEKSLQFPTGPQSIHSLNQALFQNLSEFRGLGAFSTPTLIVNGSVWQGWDKARLLSEIQANLTSD